MMKLINFFIYIFPSFRVVLSLFRKTDINPQRFNAGRSIVSECEGFQASLLDGTNDSYEVSPLDKHVLKFGRGGFIVYPVYPIELYSQIVIEMECLVCKIEDTSAKYKCPTCFIPYCSKECWKEHQAAKCTPVEPTSTPPVEECSRPLKYLFPTQDTVPREKLDLLGENADLRGILSNPHVRHMLSAIDNSPDPSSAMKAAMLEPIFVEFAEKCLEIINPSDN